MNLYNEQLVAVDSGAPHAAIVVCMPPKEPLTPEAALVFAAHLVAKANAACAEKGAPISTPRQLFDTIEKFVTGKSTPVTFARRDPNGRVAMGVPGRQFYTAGEALTFAAALVAVADPDANMLEIVSAVVADARGGNAITKELEDPRAAKINLSEPRKAVRLAESPADTTTPPALEEADFPAEEVETDAPKRKRGA